MKTKTIYLLVLILSGRQRRAISDWAETANFTDSDLASGDSD